MVRKEDIKPHIRQAAVYEKDKRLHTWKALRRIRDRYRLLADNISDVIFTMDMDLNFTYISPSVKRLLGYSEEEVAELNVREVLSTSGLEIAMKRQMDELVIEKMEEKDLHRTVSLELNVIHKNGFEIPIEARVIYLRDENNDAVGILGVARDVTERVKMEEELRHRKEYFQSLIENSRDVIVVVDRRNVVKYESHAIKSILGYSVNEVIGMDGFSFLYPEDIQVAMNTFIKVVEYPNEIVELEIRALHRDGSVRYLETVTRNLLNNPAINGIIINMRDVTERKKAEEALQRSEEYYKSLAENALDGVMVISKEGIFSYESPSVHRILGYKDGFFVGKEGFSFCHPDDIRNKRALFMQILDSPGNIIRTELRVLHQDGSWHTLEITAKNLLFDKHVNGIVANFRDITERKKMEEAREQKERYFRSLIENASDAIAVLNAEGSIRYISPSYINVMGYDPQERITRSMIDNIHKDDRKRASKSLSEIISKTDGTIQIEVRARHKDGTWHWIEATGKNYLNNQDVNGIVVNMHDITERKRAEEELQHLYEAEKKLRQRIEAEMKKRVEFTRALAHELKTPLTPMLASSESLLSIVNSEPSLSLVKNISWGAANLNNRIDELLDVARGEVGILQLRREVIDILQLLRETSSRLTARASHQGQSLILDLPSSLPYVYADITRLQQVIMNLVDNALKFSPRGGKITLKAKEHNNSIIVEVKDTGKGIHKNDQARIFEPYYRLEDGNENLSGLGLGLALCKMIIELHGGEIGVNSRVGIGSAFYFSIPLIIPQKPDDGMKKVKKLWKVLIIDDDPIIIDSITIAIQMNWPEVALITTGLGDEGVDLIETENPDAVILDIGLPDLNGLNVLEQIRLFTSVPVIVLTVRSEEVDIVKALERGADDYIVKPFKQKELIARLKAQLRKRHIPEKDGALIYGSMKYDPNTAQLTYGTKDINLTIIEGRIVETLMKNAGQVISHTRLAEEVWGDDYPGCVHNLRVNIGRLRKKIENDQKKPQIIVTKPGIGYLLAKPI